MSKHDNICAWNDITYKDMLAEAKGLLEPGEERSNPEYLRALCELVARCFGKEGMPTPERAEEVARTIGTTLKGL